MQCLPHSSVFGTSQMEHGTAQAVFAPELCATNIFEPPGEVPSSHWLLHGAIESNFTQWHSSPLSTSAQSNDNLIWGSSGKDSFV